MTAPSVPPFPACVAHHFAGHIPGPGGVCLFVCPVGHSFRCTRRKATASAERYGRNWVFLQCVSCLPVVYMITDPNREDFVERLTQLTIVRPDAEPRPLYRPPPTPPAAGTPWAKNRFTTFAQTQKQNKYFSLGLHRALNIKQIIIKNSAFPRKNCVKIKNGFYFVWSRWIHSKFNAIA